MSRLSTRLGAGLVLTLAGLTLAAPGPKSPEPKPTVPAAEAIRKALGSTNDFEFTGNPLSAVLQTIGEQYKITIVLDHATIQRSGIDAEGVAVELKMKGAKLRDALRAMIAQYGLSFAIVGETLFISTEEMTVYKQLKQRVSVDVDAVPLQKALKDLAARTGVNVIVDPRVIKAKTADTPITLQVDDVPFEAAVRLMCEMAELKPARIGNVLFVTTEARAEKLKDGDSLVPAPAFPNPMIPGMAFGVGGLGGAIQN